jgi:hypothetical protein
MLVATPTGRNRRHADITGFSPYIKFGQFSELPMA